MDNQNKKYNSIDMPMSVFMNAFCDGDLSDVEDFEDVKLDFFIACGGKKVLDRVSDMYDYEKLKLKTQLAKALIIVLEYNPSEQKFNELKALNYHMMLPNPPLTDIKKYIEQINGWLMNDIITLAELEAEKQSKDKDKDKTKVIQDRNYFTDRFLAVNSTLNLNINESSSVRMFARSLVKYEQHNERQEALNNSKI